MLDDQVAPLQAAAAKLESEVAAIHGPHFTCVPTPPHPFLLRLFWIVAARAKHLAVLPFPFGNRRSNRAVVRHGTELSRRNCSAHPIRGCRGVNSRFDSLDKALEELEEKQIRRVKHVHDELEALSAAVGRTEASHVTAMEEVALAVAAANRQSSEMRVLYAATIPVDC